MVAETKTWAYNHPNEITVQQVWKQQTAGSVMIEHTSALLKRQPHDSKTQNIDAGT
jgi:hypothetical protein